MSSNQLNLFDNQNNENGIKINWQTEHIIHLKSLKNIGNATIQQIINLCPDIDDWNIELFRGQIKEAAMNSLPEKFPFLDESDPSKVISFLDSKYPQEFNSMGIDKPILLWYKGNLDLSKSIAVVGSRNIHPSTIEITNLFTEIAVEKGFNIVSGLALGTDTVGHQKAVELNSTTTVILPSPINNIVPRENIKLANNILDNGGLFLSEYPPNEEIKKSNFVQRDRLQAGLSKAVFVGQSGIPGGTLHTVRYTLKYKKKLFVFNSNSDEKQYEGNNKLLLKPSDIDSFDFLNIKTNKAMEDLKSRVTLVDQVITNKPSIYNAIDTLL